MAKGIIVGKHEESWEKDGQTQVRRELYVLLDKPEKMPEGDQGQRVSSVKVRFDVSTVSIGDYCECVYEPVQYGSKVYAELVDVRLLGKAKMNVSIEPVKAG